MLSVKKSGTAIVEFASPYAAVSIYFTDDRTLEKFMFGYKY